MCWIGARGRLFFYWVARNAALVFVCFVTESHRSPGWPRRPSAAKTDFEPLDHTASTSPSAAHTPCFWFLSLEFPISPAVFKEPCMLTPRKVSECLCSQAETGPGVRKPWRDGSGMTESSWHLMAQQWPLPGQQGGGFALSGLISTSQLALIGPLAGSPGRETGDWQGCCAAHLARVRVPGLWGTEGSWASQKAGCWLS